MNYLNVNRSLAENGGQAERAAFAAAAEQCRGRVVRKRVWEESKKIWVVAGPAIITRFSTFGILVVSQCFIGHIGSTGLVAYALVTTLLVSLEFWYNAVLILLTGNLSNAEVYIDALTICLNINGWQMMIALGFFAAAGHLLVITNMCCVRVANELGRGSAKAAKFSILVTVITSFCIGFVLFLVFLFLREGLAYVFTQNPKVLEAVGDLSPLLSVSMLLTSVQPVLSGVSVGAGWQRVVAYVNIGSCYLIGIPVGVGLGILLHLHVKGIWIGMLFGTFVQTVMLITITLKTDWNNQLRQSRHTPTPKLPKRPRPTPSHQPRPVTVVHLWPHGHRLAPPPLSALLPLTAPDPTSIALFSVFFVNRTPILVFSRFTGSIWFLHSL